MVETASLRIRQRWWDWIAVVLLISALLTATARLNATRWTEHLGIVSLLALAGVILGLALGQSSFAPRTVFFFGLMYGLFMVPWQIGITLGRGIDWPERLRSIAGRLQIIVNELINREPITDNLLFLLAMAVVFWMLSVHAGYTLTRYGNPWRMMLPAGLAIFIIHSFDPLLAQRSWYLAVYLFFALMVIARLVFKQNLSEWKANRVHSPPDAGFDINRVALMIVILVVLVAWNVPVLAESLKPVAELWQSANRPWASFKDRASFAFASLRASVGLIEDFYGSTLSLGRGNELSDSILMEVEAPRDPFTGARYYWRARVYDQYRNSGWFSLYTDVKEMDGNSEDLLITGREAREDVSFTFFPYTALSTLYAAPQPVWLSRPADAYVSYSTDGTIDLGLVKANPYIKPGEQYEVRSSLTAVTVKELREAGNEYPEWIKERYLQLPNEITPRTFELAKRIAADLETPYDIAEAVTSYLRENIEYVEIVDQPPLNQESIDWFLFDYQKGFCNYYASAQVILLRSLGIPARMSAGFAQGERTVEVIEDIPPEAQMPIPELTSEETARFVVRQRDMHAWPEVYFPGIGWVEFEPTSAQDPIFRPLGIPLEEEINEQNDTSQVDTPQRPERPAEDLLSGLQGESGSQYQVGKFIALGGLFAFIIGLAGVLLWQTRRGFNLSAYLSQLSAEIPIRIEKGLSRLGITPPKFLRSWAFNVRLPLMMRAYQEINKALARHKLPVQLKDTPSERVNNLTNYLPQITEPAHRLLEEYQSDTYSPRSGNLLAAQLASKVIRQTSWRAWAAKIFSRFQEPAKKQPYEGPSSG